MKKGNSKPTSQERNGKWYLNGKKVLSGKIIKR